MSVLIKPEKEQFNPNLEQGLAIDHNGSDILISAGAGSGKTATLAQRIAERIDKKNKDISKMLVVTFTNDAANELKVRIKDKLAEKLENDPTNAHLRKQMTLVSGADISTIHSFCLKIIKPHFDKLGLDSGFKIGESNELDLLMQEAMSEVIDSFYESETPDPDFLLVSDCYSSYTEDTSLNNSLLYLYDQISSCPEGIDMLLCPTLDTDDIIESKYGKALLNYIDRVLRHFKPQAIFWYNEAMVDPENNKKYLGALGELCTVLADLERALSHPKYDTFKGILEKYPQCSLRGGSKTAVPTFDVDEMTLFRKELDKVLKSLATDYFYSDKVAIASVVERNDKMCRAIHTVFKAFEEKYREKKQKLGVCDFDDLERLALKLLYADNGVATQLKEKYDELYIDEYQDVSAIQDKIFNAFAKNNRFMVGDIKQSIYRFRAAEPELFSNYRDSFVPYDEEHKDCPKGTPRSLFMSSNYRCDPDVIKTANHVSDFMFLNSKGFTYVTGDRLKCLKKQKVSKRRLEKAKKLKEQGFFKTEDEYQEYIKYLPQRAELHIIDRQAFKADESFPEELDPQAEYVAQKIKELLNNGELPNRDKVEPKHIAILLKKASGQIDKYIEALNRYGIKNEYVQEISFFEKPHVLLMRSILNVIDNPVRDVYLAGAMHSHVFGFSLEELVKIKMACPDEQSLYSALKNYTGETALEGKIKGFLAKLDTYRAKIRALAADEAVAYILKETGFISSCNSEERQDAIKLYDMARAFEQGSFKGLYRFLKHIDDTAEKGINETVSSDPKNSVKIMTMHKSKGLEYEICFLCDTEKSYFRGGEKPNVYYDRRLGVCGYVSREGGVVKYNNILRRLMELYKKEVEVEEALRVLYVAMTRARSKLYIVATEDDGGKKRALANARAHLNDDYVLYNCHSHFKTVYTACHGTLPFLDIVEITPDMLTGASGSSSGDMLDTAMAEAIKEKLKNRLDFKYKYEHLSKIPSKLSISTLSPEILDDEENKRYQKKWSSHSLPEFALDKKRTATAAEKGTATHVFLQFCDFDLLTKHGVECELNRLVDEKFISKPVAKNVNTDHLEAFITSKFMSMLKGAKKIIREFRFNVFLPASDFTTDKDTKEQLKDEKVLVQGVTDCIFETQEGDLILVDYKTDEVTWENYIDKLRERHSDQINYYRLACKKMFGRDISKAYIYSVPLAELVEIK